ncbi:hypothetical protein [Paucisalibacillus globulus]|uniref:hypothetical protein n=1 Tax=Paucisalibacillus globulus TaxID=351095 RepID=UPI0015969273|nr:hypothetical protein [Paucisalibacillus globulus]
MKLADHLSKEQRKKLNKHRHKKQQKEKVNWHDIMGVNRDTYKRGRGGAYRSNKK